MSLDGAPLHGHPSARIGVIEYSDFECPFCGKFATATYPTIVKAYVETGKVQFAFRHLPLKQHPLAMKAAEAAECSRRQGRFWPMHDALFTMPRALDSDSLLAKAKTLGLDSGQFQRCMDGEAITRVRQDVAEAQALGITGTPTFLFGTIEPDGRLKVVRRESGAIPAKAFAGMLDDLVNPVTRVVPY
jgi:protein-disulfide isomerase